MSRQYHSAYCTRRYCVVVCMAFVLWGGLTAQLSAAPIRYTMSGIVAGTLGNVPFNTQLIVESFADTSDIHFGSNSLVYIVPTTATTFTINGVGTGTFNVPTQFISNNNFGTMGVVAPTVENGWILGALDSQFAGYHLATEFGPVVTEGLFNEGVMFDTTAGKLGITTERFPVTFQAAFVPEPAATGDYNNNGKVDAADYIVWRHGNGSVADYNLWRAHFGETSVGISSAADDVTSVPEPSTIVFAIPAVAVLPTRRRKSVPHNRV